MVVVIRRPCKRCHRLIEDGSTVCPECKRTRNAIVDTARKFYGTRRWRSTRELVLERDGHRCVAKSDDGSRCPETTDLEIHHLIPVAQGGDRHDERNLVALCRWHHHEITATTRREARRSTRRGGAGSS
jgi:hypothetical protein